MWLLCLPYCEGAFDVTTLSVTMWRRIRWNYFVCQIVNAHSMWLLCLPYCEGAFDVTTLSAKLWRRIRCDYFVCQIVKAHSMELLCLPYWEGAFDVTTLSVILWRRIRCDCFVCHIVNAHSMWLLCLWSCEGAFDVISLHAISWRRFQRLLFALVRLTVLYATTVIELISGEIPLKRMFFSKSLSNYYQTTKARTNGTQTWRGNDRPFYLLAQRIISIKRALHSSAYILPYMLFSLFN